MRSAARAIRITLVPLWLVAAGACVGKIGGPPPALEHDDQDDAGVEAHAGLIGLEPAPDTEDNARDATAQAESTIQDAGPGADDARPADASHAADGASPEAGADTAPVAPGADAELPPDGGLPAQDADLLPDAGLSPDLQTAADAGGDGPPVACPAAALGDRLGTDRLMLGGNVDDPEWEQAALDLRYRYLANDVPADGPCDSCDASCPLADTWWGCWQDQDDPPGKFVVSLVQDTEAAGAIPMITYYTWFYVAGNVEGEAEIAALADAPRVARYLADFRFACQQIADGTAGPVILHVEPDLWGFGNKSNPDPEAIVAAVSAAAAPECAGEPDTLGGLARCMLHIARHEAPGAIVGFHASGWGAGKDALKSKDPSLDIDAHAAETTDFMNALGAADADLVVVEMSDRDAGFDGEWWDANNLDVPNFDRALRWASQLGAGMDLPFLWWQVPFGNMALPGGCHAYTDNRLDYFFDHAQDFAAAGNLGIAFGAGSSSCGTTAASDNGHFVQRAQAYFAGPRPCLCDICN